MKVSNCKNCAFCKRKTWTSYYKPTNYHAIGMTHAYHYCERYKKKCLIIKGCGAFISKKEIDNETDN